VKGEVRDIIRHVQWDHLEKHIGTVGLTKMAFLTFLAFPGLLVPARAFYAARCT
jgi:hypothetical protein